MLSRTQYNNIEWDFQMREDIGVFSVGSGEGVGKRGGCRVLIITYYYNMCMFHHRWGWWGLLPVLQRVVLVTAGGGAENLVYWLGNTGVTCVLVGVLNLCQSVMTM